jgi:hypothetical protein
MREEIQYIGRKNSLSFREAFSENVRTIYLVVLGLVVCCTIFAMVLGR